MLKTVASRNLVKDKCKRLIMRFLSSGEKIDIFSILLCFLMKPEDAACTRGATLQMDSGSHTHTKKKNLSCDVNWEHLGGNSSIMRKQLIRAVKWRPRVLENLIVSR